VKGDMYLVSKNSGFVISVGYAVLHLDKC
jgi:hypothetical protein